MSLHPIGQPDELCDAQHLGTQREKFMFRAPKIAESGPQGVADRLAALVEGRLDHLQEQPFIAVETLHAVAAQADDGALTFGGGLKTPSLTVNRYSIS